MKKIATITAIRREQIASATDSDRARITTVSNGHAFHLDVSWEEADGLKEGDEVEISFTTIAKRPAPAPKKKK